MAEAGYLYFLDALLFSGIHLLLHSLATKQGLQCGTLRGETIFLQGQLYFWKNQQTDWSGTQKPAGLEG